MARLSEQRPSPWMLKLGPRKTGTLVVAIFLATGVGLLVAAVVKAHGVATFLALGVSFALGAATVPLLSWQRRWSGSMPNWLFGATIGAAPVIGTFLPGPAIVALLAMGAGFMLTFAPVHLASQRAHRTEIEERWASWQG